MSDPSCATNGDWDSEDDACTTPGCDGDGRYSAPGRGHRVGCHCPLPADPSPDLDALERLLGEATGLPWRTWADGHVGSPDHHIGGIVMPTPGSDRHQQLPDAALIAAAVNALPALLAIAREHKTESHGPGWFWTRTEWAEWSNDLARLVPEEYGDDVAQEAIIERALTDLVRRAETAEAENADLRARLAAVRALLRFEYISQLDLHAALTTEAAADV